MTCARTILPSLRVYSKFALKKSTKVPQCIRFEGKRLRELVLEGSKTNNFPYKTNNHFAIPVVQTQIRENHHTDHNTDRFVLSQASRLYRTSEIRELIHSFILSLSLSLSRHDIVISNNERTRSSRESAIIIDRVRVKRNVNIYTRILR